MKKDFKNYRAPVEPVIIYHPFNLIYDDLGKEALRSHNRKFKGIQDIEDTFAYRKGQPISFSNTPRALSYARRVSELTEARFRVLTFEDAIRNFPFIPEIKTTYADTCEIVIYPNVHENPDNERLRMQTLSHLGLTKIDAPLRVSGLDADPDNTNNTYRFKVTPTQDLKAIPSPFFEKDCKVRWEEGKIVICKEDEEGVPVWTPSSQSGLRGLYRGRSDGLSAWVVNLLYSNESGRVQLVQEPKARA